MSQKLILVKYELENGIPIDESSENLSSAYAPPELLNWATEKGFITKIIIRESLGEVADVPVSIIDDGENTHLNAVFQYIEAELIKYIEDAHSHISGGVLKPKELDRQFSSLHIWLEARNIFKEKMDKYNDNCNIKIVVG
ncbi:hypothetical protein [Pseudomonas lactis]|uniref:hypothetical protein n=1 Tax=Pseudomonas lactis TaxID=1615674 RepID=UPI00190A64DC|nr:hypothetical protein [Pseudomonas lactis]MBK3445844.1 hypothetical protein [Pseudomonas lactis]